MAGKAAFGAKAAKIAAAGTTVGLGVGFNASDLADRVAAARARGEEVSDEQEDAAIILAGLLVLLKLLLLCLY